MDYSACHIGRSQYNGGMLHDTEPVQSEVSAAKSLLQTVRSERDALQAQCEIYLAEIEKLQAWIKKLQRAQFGARSEKLDPDQLQLAIEESEQTAGLLEATREKTESQKPQAEKKPSKPRNNNRGALPAHLPREHVVIEPEDKSCPCCGGELHAMGEDVSEQLDIMPAQFKVKVIHRPKFACRACEEAVVQAPAPERLITGGMATEGVVAQVLTSKYADHTPLYRQSAIYARQGITLDRATLANWVGHACWWLQPLQQLMITTILSSGKIFADDTTVPVLDPGRGKTKTGRFWAYGCDDRPWQGPLPPVVVYIYSENRKGEHPIGHLAGYTGVLQVDGYAAFDTIATASKGTVILAFCWSHARRKFFDFFEATQSPIAAEALRRIAELYAIEDDIRGRTAEERQTQRQLRAKPLVEALNAWLKQKLQEISRKSELAKAIRYALGRWEGLCVFLSDGRVEMDTNVIERAMRPQKLTVKNTLFAGSDAGAKHWAIVASLIETCRLNGIEPFAYLKDILERMVAGHPISRLAELLPWNWKTLTEILPPGG
jgi:transposase